MDHTEFNKEAIESINEAIDLMAFRKPKILFAYVQFEDESTGRITPSKINSETLEQILYDFKILNERNNQQP